MKSAAVVLSPETHARVAEYASAARTNLNDAVNKILNRWMDDVGFIVLERLQANAGSRKTGASA
jgi:hypothetical protein